MAMRRLRMIFITALLALLPSAAFAQSTWDVLQSFGYTGAWAISCDKPPSPDNPRMTLFRDTDGVVKRKFDNGPLNPTLMLAPIISAQIITSTTMMIHSASNYTTNYSLDYLIIKENYRTRTLESKTTDGKELIKDGVIISDNQPAPWFERCQN
jgi:hypothetical protein